jgi:hypothetical protein
MNITEDKIDIPQTSTELTDETALYLALTNLRLRNTNVLYAHKDTHPVCPEKSECTA